MTAHRYKRLYLSAALLVRPAIGYYVCQLLHWSVKRWFWQVTSKNCVLKTRWLQMMFPFFVCVCLCLCVGVYVHKPFSPIKSIQIQNQGWEWTIEVFWKLSVCLSITLFNFLMKSYLKCINAPAHLYATDAVMHMHCLVWLTNRQTIKDSSLNMFIVCVYRLSSCNEDL